MNKLLSSLVFAALASFGFSAHAMSHAGGAPMKAEAPAKVEAAKAEAAKPAASAPKKAQKAASGAKAEMKKEEAKK